MSKKRLTTVLQGNILRNTLQKVLIASPDQTQAEKWGNLLRFGFVTAFALLSLFQLQQIYLDLYDIDFKAFDLAIKSLLTPGDSPYRPHGIEQSFHYPLWTSFLYLPIAGLEHGVAQHAWLILNMVVLLPVVWLLQRLYLPDWKPICLPFLYCVAVALSSINFLDGYPNVLLTGGLALMLTALKAGRPIQAGGWGVLALVMKPQLTFLVGLSLLLWLFTGSLAARREARRWWLGAVGVGLALIILTTAIMPDWIFQLYHAVSTENLNGGIHPDGKFYTWVTATFPEWFNYLTNLDGWPVTASYLVFGLILAGVGLYRLLSWREQPAIWIALIVALNLALTPYGRPYDYPFLLLPLFCLMNVAWQAYQHQQFKRTLAYSGILALVFILTALNRDFRWFYFQPLLLSLALLTVGVGDQGSGIRKSSIPLTTDN